MADELYKRLSCDGSAKAFSRLVTSRDFVCAHCMCGFRATRARTYCTEKCKYTAAERRRGSKPRQYRQACTCKNCGVRYVPKAASRTSYCSRACAFSDMATWRAAQLSGAGKPKYCKVYFPSCAVCSRRFPARNLLAARCSDECDKQFARQRAYENNSAKHLAVIAPKVCKCCGARFTPPYGSKRRDFCTDSCAKRVGRAVSKALRNARTRGNRAESVNPFKVFERDEWKCQMCGIDTPRSLRGTTDPRAPELDHLVALSLGGEHSLSNVACLCRRCNGLKSNLPLDRAIEVCCAAA